MESGTCHGWGQLVILTFLRWNHDGKGRGVLNAYAADFVDNSNCTNIQPRTLLKAYKSRIAPGTTLSSLLIEVTWAAFIRFGRSYRTNWYKKVRRTVGLRSKTVAQSQGHDKRFRS